MGLDMENDKGAFDGMLSVSAIDHPDISTSPIGAPSMPSKSEGDNEIPSMSASIPYCSFLYH